MEDTQKTSRAHIENPSEEEWASAKRDAAVLEKAISILVEDFEKKHRPLQLHILSRYRNLNDLYDVEKGGGTQILVRKCAAGSDPVTSSTDWYLTPRKEVHLSNLHLIQDQEK
jgi:hypothetical protein